MRMVTVAKRANTIEYAIRDIVVPADKLEKEGHEILKLNIGDPNKYDFDTPQFIKDAFKDAIQNNDNGYTASAGLPSLREAIVEKEKRMNNVSLDPDRIIVTNGVSEGLLFLFGSLVEPGDEVLIPGPSYPPYISFVKYFGGTPVEYKTVEEDGWQPDIQDLESKINEKTKAVVIINPNNPTGAKYSKQTLQKMIDIIAQHKDLFLISDEIYDQMVYDDFTSPCEVAGDEIPYVQMNGISKCYLAPGWRIGSLHFSNNEGADGMYEGCIRQARIRLCASAPAQRAYEAALKGQHDHIRETMNKLKERRDFSYKRVNEIEGMSMAKPEGAFYMFPKIEDPRYSGDDKKFVLDLLHKKHVLFVNGSGFGKEYGSGHIRSVYLPPVDVLGDAFNRLEDFLKSR